jgi:hypothetical protein
MSWLLEVFRESPLVALSLVVLGLLVGPAGLRRARRWLGRLLKR